MYIIRDIFQLRFGHFRDAKALLEEAKNKNLLPTAQHLRVLTDFTGDAYRLILEEGYASLAEYESSLTGGMGQSEWKDWYEKFKQHVESSHREILKQIL
ncbi:hypothetical protein V9K67_09880 [Paraflavisolibacter sp. H34]|uniref:hypothetical protein n=1 Tax=Huijunlia imazamoxiresistens TaxID=3127457 RepID=UPI0030171CC8